VQAARTAAPVANAENPRNSRLDRTFRFDILTSPYQLKDIGPHVPDPVG